MRISASYILFLLCFLRFSYSDDLIWRSADPVDYGNYGPAAIFPDGNRYIYVSGRNEGKQLLNVKDLSSGDILHSYEIQDSMLVKCIIMTGDDHKAVIVFDGSENGNRILIYDDSLDQIIFDRHENLNLRSYNTCRAFIDSQGKILTLLKRETDKDYYGVSRWDIQSGTKISDFFPEKNYAYANISNNGAYIINSRKIDDISVLTIYSTDTKEIKYIKTFDEDENISNFMALTSDMKKAYFLINDSLAVLDLEKISVEKLMKIEGHILYMELSRNEDYLVMKQLYGFFAVDPGSRKIVRRIGGDDPGIKYGSYDNNYSFDKDLKTVVINYHTKNMYLQDEIDRYVPAFFDFRNNKLLFSLPGGNTTYINRLNFSTSGKLLYSEDQNNILCIRSTENGEIIGRILCKNTPAFSVDDKKLLIPNGIDIISYDIENETYDTVFNARDTLQTVISSPGGNLIAAISDENLYFINYPDFSLSSVKNFNNETFLLPARFSRDGQYFGIASFRSAFGYGFYNRYNLSDSNDLYKQSLIDENYGLLSDISDDCMLFAIKRNSVFNTANSKRYRIYVNDEVVRFIPGCQNIAVRYFETDGQYTQDKLRITDYTDGEIFCSYENKNYISSQNFIDLEISPDGEKIALAKYGSAYLEMRGVCSFSDVEGGNTSMENNAVSVYPNPFCNNTNIILDIGKNCYINACIYDMRGSRIGNVYSGNAEPGRLNLTWKPRGINPGIYILRITAGREVTSKVLVLN